APSPRKTWLVEGAVGCQRSQSTREVLPAHLSRTGTVVARAGQMVAARRRHRSHSESRAGDQGVAMGPRQEELDDEIRGHLALSIKERIERGDDPAAARLAALKEFGNVTLTRDSMRSVWRPRWFTAVEALGRDIRFAFRSLLRAKGLTITVV